MKPLVKFTGRWDAVGGKFKFTWDPKELGTDAFIVIAAVEITENGMRLQEHQYSVEEICNLSGMGNTYDMKIQGAKGYGVHKMLFCGLSAESVREASFDNVLNYCRSDSSCMITVMMGKADITWSEKTSVQDTVKIVTLEITSNCEISPDVLGYQCTYARGPVIKMPFPGKIMPGKQPGYMPIVVPRDCQVTVVPYDVQFSGNLEIRKKKKLFGF